MPNDPDDESAGKSGNSGAGESGGTGGGSSMPGGEGQFPFGDRQQMAEMFRRFADMVDSQPAPGQPGEQSGPVNWDTAKNIARHSVAERGDSSVDAKDRSNVDNDLRLADLWLNEATTLPSGNTTNEAWSRSEWIEKTMPAWSQLCGPLTARIVESMGANLPEEMRSMAGPLMGMVQQMGGMLVGQQAGQAIGELAGEVVGSTDIGIPLAGAGHAALLPAGIAAFGEGLEVDTEEVRLYLAARESAHHRLFSHVPWLRSHLFNLVEEYARGMSFDMSRLEDKLGEIDIANPEAIQNALMGSGEEALFQPEDTPQQKAALARLETSLALVEGWVSVVVDDGIANRLPHAPALSEAIRRRRATGGPAERTFATLVGLELRPRRSREAAALWRELGEARGIDGRDALWEHPDLMPSTEDLNDPAQFVHGRADADAAQLDITEITGEKEEEKEDRGEDGDGQ